MSDETKLFQRWLEKSWLTGDIYTGFSCLPDASTYASWHLAGANGYDDRFCTEPAPLTMPAMPGGQCRSGPNGGKGKVDLFILVDLSGSFSDDWPAFQADAPAIIQVIQNKYDAQFGLAIFQDYPIAPFGNASLGDRAYTRILDLTPDATSVVNAINAIPAPVGGIGVGGDLPQSQLEALYQVATGSGQDFSATAYPDATIAPGQGVTFRSGASKLIL